MEQEACTGAQGLSSGPAAHVLSEKLQGARQMDDLHEEMELRVNSLHLSEQYGGRFHLTSAGVEQGACTCVRGLAPDSATHVLSDKLLGDLQMNDLHEEIKYPVISSRLSKLYEGHFCFINAGSGVKQEACIGVRGIAPDLATHVLSNKSLRTLHQADG